MKTANELKEIEENSHAQFKKFIPLIKKYFTAENMAGALLFNYMIDETEISESEWGSIDYIIDQSKLIDKFESKIQELYLIVSKVYEDEINNKVIDKNDIKNLFDYTYANRKIHFLSSEMYYLLHEQKYE